MNATATTPEQHEHEHHHEHDAHAHEHKRRLGPGLLVLAGLIAPVALVAVLFDANDADHGGYTCPLREATGIPCPACGATRAFFHLANGDMSFLHFNWMWPLMWVLATGWAVVLVVRGFRGEPLLGSRIRNTWDGLAHWSMKRTVATPFILLAPAWIVALANIHNINAS